MKTWQDWLLAIAFIAAFGWAGSNDFDYRCKQAHDANPSETCVMVAHESEYEDSQDYESDAVEM